MDHTSDDRVLTARVEQIIYNGPIEYPYDYRWVVRDNDGCVIGAGTSSSISWALEDCKNGLDDYTVILDFEYLPRFITNPGITVIDRMVVSGGPGVPWPPDVEAFFASKVG